MENYKITQDMFETAIDKLVSMIQESGFVPSVIIAPVRGGLVPATYISHRLGDIPVRCWHKGEDIKLLGENVLVVDDISDSGKTLIEILQRITELGTGNHIRTATICMRASTDLVPDYVPTVLELDNWVVFPWEKD